MDTGLLSLLGLGGLGAAGVGTAYNKLEGIGKQAKQEATTLANQIMPMTQFRPFTVTAATGGQFGVTPQMSTVVDPETGIELYNQSPDWVIRRDDGLGNFFELRLDQQYGYNVNMQQQDFEYYDYQLGDGQNAIDIKQVQ